MDDILDYYGDEFAATKAQILQRAPQNRSNLIVISLFLIDSDGKPLSGSADLNLRYFDDQGACRDVFSSASAASTKGLQFVKDEKQLSGWGLQSQSSSVGKTDSAEIQNVLVAAVLHSNFQPEWLHSVLISAEVHLKPTMESQVASGCKAILTMSTMTRVYDDIATSRTSKEVIELDRVRGVRDRTTKTSMSYEHRHDTSTEWEDASFSPSVHHYAFINNCIFRQEFSTPTSATPHSFWLTSCELFHWKTKRKTRWTISDRDFGRGHFVSAPSSALLDQFGSHRALNFFDERYPFPYPTFPKNMYLLGAKHLHVLELTIDGKVLHGGARSVTDRLSAPDPSASVVLLIYRGSNSWLPSKDSQTCDVPAVRFLPHLDSAGVRALHRLFKSDETSADMGSLNADQLRVLPVKATAFGDCDVQPLGSAGDKLFWQLAFVRDSHHKDSWTLVGAPHAVRGVSCPGQSSQSWKENVEWLELVAKSTGLIKDMSAPKGNKSKKAEKPALDIPEPAAGKSSFLGGVDLSKFTLSLRVYEKSDQEKYVAGSWLPHYWGRFGQPLPTTELAALFEDSCKADEEKGIVTVDLTEFTQKWEGAAQLGLKGLPVDGSVDHALCILGLSFQGLKDGKQWGLTVSLLSKAKEEPDTQLFDWSPASCFTLMPKSRTDPLTMILQEIVLEGNNKLPPTLKCFASEVFANCSLQITCANDLLKADIIGTSDPYVRFTIEDMEVRVLQQGKTPVLKNTLDPIWDFSTKIETPITHNLVLKCILYDWDLVGKHDELGMCTWNFTASMDPIPPAPLGHQRSFSKVINLNSTAKQRKKHIKATGTIHVGISF
jgi:hypothetical protein